MLTERFLLAYQKYPLSILLSNNSMLPVTEQSHPFAKNLDGRLSPEAFLRILRQCDAQVFTGVDGAVGLLDEPMLRRVSRSTLGARSALQQELGSVVMTGCGTSGRLAFLTSRRYAKRHPGKFCYAHAGGDAALLLSDELPEDDFVRGEEDVMRALSANVERHGGPPSSTPTKVDVYVIGVSCGLSAPYVAGQMARYASAEMSTSLRDKLEVRSHGVAWVGFNPAALVRETPFPAHYGDRNAAPSLRSLAMQLDQASDPAAGGAAGGSRAGPESTLINPIIGPEPISGSSRMKGGTATLILLDVICRGAARSEASASTPESIGRLLQEFQCVHSATYLCGAQSGLHELMEACATAIRSGGHVYYLGAGSAGCVAAIDLSEMPDTYGAPFHQMRAFIAGGWSEMQNSEGDISNQNPLLRCSLNDFETEILGTLTAQDLVIAVVSAIPDDHDNDSATSAGLADIARLVSCCVKGGARCCSVSVENLSVHHMTAQHAIPYLCALRSSCTTNVIVQLADTCDGAHSDLAVKLLLNAVSTFGQAAGRGAVYRGTMIGTGPSNDKIYDRCIRLIADTMECSAHDSEVALLRAIYGLDSRHEAEMLLRTKPRREHIVAALQPEHERHRPQSVLPIAFLLAKAHVPGHPGWSYADAKLHVEQEPLLFRLLENDRVLVEHRRSGAPTTLCKSDHTHAAIDVVLGVDIGGTKVRCGLVHAGTGAIVFRSVCALGDKDRSPAAFLSVVTREIRNSIAFASGQANEEVPNPDKPKRRPLNVIAVGIGQPGHVAPDGSIQCLAAFPDWGTSLVPLKSAVEQCITTFVSEATTCAVTHPPSVFVFDDAESALAGELMFGAARLAPTAVMLTVGTGIGSAVSFANGVLHRGGRGLIELGHSLLWAPPNWDTHGQRGAALPTSPQCPCGQRGCVELAASGTAIKALQSCGQAFGDAVHSAAQALTVCTLNAVRAYDPDVVVFGGGLGQEMVARVRREYRTRAWSLHDDCAEVPFMPASCVEPGVQGAAALALRLVRPVTSRSRFSLRRARRESDLDGLLNVCLKTGDAGADASHLFSDPKLLGNIYVAPYVFLSSTFAFALIDNDMQDFGGVCGYVLGVLSTDAFQQACASSWRPDLRQQYRGHTNLLPNEKALVDEMILAPDDVLDAPRADWTKYPSHMHIDILPHAQGVGFGVIMVQRLLACLVGAGSTGVHLGMAPTNSRAFAFYTKLGFQRIPPIATEEEKEWILGMSLT